MRINNRTPIIAPTMAPTFDPGDSGSSPEGGLSVVFAITSIRKKMRISELFVCF